MDIDLHSLSIEVSTKCNLKCSYCPRMLEDKKYQNKIISQEMFDFFLERFGGNFSRLTLSGLGEPTFCEDLPKYIGHAQKTNRFQYIDFCTNLSLVSHEFYEECFRCGLSTLLISFDSMQGEINKLCRVNTNTNQLMITIEKLAKKFPEKLFPTTVVGDYNVDMLEDMYDYFVSLGITRWRLQNEILFSNGEKRKNDARVMALLKKLKERKEIDVMMLHFTSRQCIMPYSSAMITISGDVIPCCSVYRDHDYILGNIYNNSRQEIYESERAKNFFVEFKESRQKTCIKCAMYR